MTKMKSLLVKVFIAIGCLALGVIGWDLFFNPNPDQGILATGYKAIATPINSTYQTITGDSDAFLVPEEWKRDANTLSEGKDLIE